jgi:hypothetical protein
MTVSPPPGSPPPAQPGTTSGKGWIKWVAIGCGGLIVLAAAFAVFMFVVVKKATAGPETVVHAFLDAAGAGDYETAWDCFSAPLKEAQPFDQFEAAAKGQPSLFKVRDTTFNNRSVNLNGAELSGTLTLESGTEVPASFKLVQENDHWKLLGYHIGSE